MKKIILTIFGCISFSQSAHPSPAYQTEMFCKFKNEKSVLNVKILVDPSKKEKIAVLVKNPGTQGQKKLIISISDSSTSYDDSWDYRGQNFLLHVSFLSRHSRHNPLPPYGIGDVEAPFGKFDGQFPNENCVRKVNN